MYRTSWTFDTSWKLSQDDDEEQEEVSENVDPVSERVDPLEEVEFCAETAHADGGRIWGWEATGH